MAVPVVTIYRNGDLHFYGKKLVVNPKNISTFDNFLDKVTHDTQARVAIRRLCTPNHGSRILKLDQLQNGGVYVAVGAEKFKRLQYDALRSTHPTLQPRKPTNQTVKPVLHSRIHASARYQKAAQAEPLKNRIVFVYKNGDTKHPGIKLLLDKRILQSMEIVLQYVTDKIQLRTGAVKSIYTLEGTEVKETKDFVTGTRYVAVGYGNVFIKTMYSQNTPFSVTPRRLTQSKNSTLVNSSPKNKTLKRIDAKVRKKSTPEKTADKKESKPERTWRTHLKKGTPPALNESETNNNIENTNESEVKSEYNDSVEDEANNENEAGNKLDTNDTDDSDGDDDVGNELEKEDTVKSDSPIIYEASGEQSEKAEFVKDNQDTKVEKTLDMQDAEEVDEEIIENEDVSDDDEGDTADDKNLITIKN